MTPPGIKPFDPSAVPASFKADTSTQDGADAAVDDTQGQEGEGETGGDEGGGDQLDIGGGTYNAKKAWKVIDRSRQVTASEVDRKQFIKQLENYQALLW